jgi:hypothetical protein
LVALQTSLFKPAEGYRLHTNVQACRSLSEMVCPVYEQNFEATEFLFGSGVFCIARRLTGFGGARNIIRIRTNTRRR